MGLENKLIWDVDHAIDLFEEHFSKHLNVKFCVGLPQKQDLPIFPEYQLKLLEIITELKQDNWVVKFGGKQIDERYAGYVYVRKEEQEYSVIGFVKLEDSKLVADGVLYGHKDNLENIYEKILKRVEEIYGKKPEKLEPVEYAWQKT